MGQVVISIISGAMFGAVVVFLIHINAEMQRLKREVQWIKQKIGGVR
jgi:hypothetical protein